MVSITTKEVISSLPFDNSPASFYKTPALHQLRCDQGIGPQLRSYWLYALHKVPGMVRYCSMLVQTRNVKTEEGWPKTIASYNVQNNFI